MNDKNAAIVSMAKDLLELQSHPKWESFLDIVANEGALIKRRFHACNNADERAVIQGESKHNDLILNLVGVYMERARRVQALDNQ